MKKVLFGLILSVTLLTSTTISSIAENDELVSSTSTTDELVSTTSTSETEIEIEESTSDSETIEVTTESETVEVTSDSEDVYFQEETRSMAMSALLSGDSITDSFINDIAPTAKLESRKHGLYTSVMIAQAILESNSGRSNLAVSPNNNLFGIKGTYNEQSVLHKTEEWDANKNSMVPVEVEFKKYPNRAASINDNALKLRYGPGWDSSYYSGAWIENTNSYKDATKALTGTYATDPNYDTKLNQIIATYNLTQYDEEQISSLSKEVSIKPGAQFNVHSRPYTYHGSEVIGTTVPHQGKQVLLSSQAKTSNGIYYYVESIGWIHSSAFSNSLDSLTKKSINKHAKIRSDKYYFFYKEPYNTKGAYRIGTSTQEFYNQDVEITEQAINNKTNEVFYLVKNQGWLGAGAFSLIYDDENIIDISKDVSIKSNASNNVHTRPFPYYGFKITGNTIPLRGTQVHLSKEAKTSNGTYYLADGFGWIHSAAFTSSLDTLTKKTTNQIAKIHSSNSYFFYKEPYNTKGASRVGPSSSSVANQEVDITQKATINRTKEEFYFVKNQGWLPSAAFSIIYDEENIKKVSKDLTITSSATNNIHSRPYPYHGFKITGTTKAYQGTQVHISEEAVTSNGTYYFVDKIGWIRNNAFTTKIDTVTKTTFNRDAKILNKSFFFYSEPYNTKGSARNGKNTNSIKNTDVVLTQKAVSKNNGNIYYFVKNQGWVDQKALLIYDVPKYETINVQGTVLSNVSYNVHTEPYPYKGVKVIGNTSSLKMNNKTFTIKRQAITSNGIYYQVPNYGWVNKKAFSTDAEKYKKVQALLNQKYKTGNYGVYVQSLKTNSSAGIYADTIYSAASTGKLPAIYYTQKRYNDKTLNPNTMYRYGDHINQMSESYGRGGAGILQYRPFGGLYTIDNMLNWTIYYSDNQGANFLGYYAANQFSSSMKKEISGIIGRQWTTPFRITAKENGKLMEAIYKLGGNANKYLQNTTFDKERIPKYLPVKVGHKVGDVYSYRHDVAIVYANEPYILSVMSKNYQSYESISQMSLEIYNILK